MAANARKGSAGDRASENPYRPFVPFQRPSPFHGSLNLAAACCPEEEELARSLADEFAYAIAVAALSSDKEACCCANSVVAAARRRLAQLDAKKRAAIQARAREILGKDAAEQQRYFGSFAGPGARDRLNAPVLNRQRRALLERAVRKRLELQSAETSALHKFYMAGGLKALLAAKTRLEGVASFELASFFTERNMNEPETLTFRWNTEVEEAEIGQWKVCRLPSRSVVASGSVGVGHVLTIDFKQFLAPQPSPTPQLYEVTVTPATAPKFVKQPGASPGSTITAKVPSEAVGLPSNPVRIAYVRDTSIPQVFDELRVYRTLELHIDHLEMVEQQSGFGKDEYWLYGTVHESAGAEDITVFELPKRFALLPEEDDAEDDTPTIKELNDTRSFHLEYPSSARWPKTYTVTLTVIESDGGEEVAEWMAFVWDTASLWITAGIRDFVENDLGLEGFAANASAASLAAIAGALAASIGAAIGGLVLAFAAGILAMVTAAVADDYYETKALILVLPTNTEDYVAELDGAAQPDGTYRLKARYPQFRYQTQGSGSVQLRDGLVGVKLHWELKDQEILLGG